MDEIDVEIVDLYVNKKMSISDIAVETALSPTYIRETLKTAGVFEPRKNIKFTPRNDVLTKIAADTAEIYRRYRVTSHRKREKKKPDRTPVLFFFRQDRF